MKKFQEIKIIGKNRVTKTIIEIKSFANEDILNKDEIKLLQCAYNVAFEELYNKGFFDDMINEYISETGLTHEKMKLNSLYGRRGKLK